MYTKILIICLFLFCNIQSQTDRETRAVWVATNFRLDWPPPTYDVSEQKNELVKILDNLENRNYNTIYFQVRFNGTVLFNSSYEPWSHYIAGNIGEEPDYDPLNFAIEEAHKRGLEIHAWFNMVRCYSGNEQNVFDYPAHVLNKHPEWIHKVNVDGEISYWLDPGLPEVREYLANIVCEAVSKYNFDGIQFDFIRYPSREIDDSFAYNLYGENKDKNQWRRENITDIVKQISLRAYELNPDLIIGAAPLGIYKNKPGATGLQSYYEVFQESRLWLREQYIDYLAPQIYWNISDKPRFDLLVKDWLDESFGRNIVIGIASYKKNVKSETHKMIDYTRSQNAAGVAFFRYEFITDADYFDSKSYPAEINWKKKSLPAAPVELVADIKDDTQNKIELTWIIPELTPESKSIEYFSIYDLNNKFDEMSSENLFKVISADRTSLIFNILNPARINYYFAVRSLNRFWYESKNRSNIVEISIPVLKSLSQDIELIDNVFYVDHSTDENIIIITTSRKEEVIITFQTEETAAYRTELLLPGLNIINTDTLHYNSIKVKFSNGTEKHLHL